jgi:hypothetical protein
MGVVAFSSSFYYDAPSTTNKHATWLDIVVILGAAASLDFAAIVVASLFRSNLRLGWESQFFWDCTLPFVHRRPNKQMCVSDRLFC